MMQINDRPKTRKLVIFGDSLFAEVAYECFARDSEYEVAGFAVEQAYLKKNTLFGLPVVAIERVAEIFSPESHDVYVAIVYTQLNRLRTRLMHMAEGQGYKLATYVSSNAFIWPNVKLGKHCFILENNVLQPYADIGNNVVIWSGNHIGHHSKIHDNVFISSHVVISGACHIGNNCFLGVNTTISNNITIGEDCFLNLATVVTKSLDDNKMYRGNPASIYRDNARSFFTLHE